MTETKNRLVVDTCGTMTFPDGYTGPGVMLTGKLPAVKVAAKHFARGVVLLGCDDIEELAERIEEAMDNVNDMDVTFADFALAIACDLTGADLNEAYAARKAAKVAAE